MVKATSLAALLPVAAAFPAAMQMDAALKRANSLQNLNLPKGGESLDQLEKRIVTIPRSNLGGGHPIATFDAVSQYVDVSPNSGHEFQSPVCPGDHRGQCPGLNAAANHGFLPRNGLPTLAQTITGLGDAYNMGADLAAALAAISILDSGDIPSLTWSIGGGFPSTAPGVLSNPSGILGTHDRYEGDASIVRGDAYLHDGNVDYFEFRSWENLYSLVGDNLGFAQVANQSNFVTTYSVENNPYYFSGPFSGLVAPAAHNFVVAFMSNHSAENPGGYLDTEILKSFFAVTGEPGNFVWNKYQERIPDNWYKRPGGINDYNLADVFIDIIEDAAIYPNILKIGGNTGTVNSFTGVDISNLTAGAFNAETLLQGNNLGCFFFQAASLTALDGLNGAVADLGAVLAPITAALTSLDCPQLHQPFEFQLFELFPGFKYQPASQPTCPAENEYENGSESGAGNGSGSGSGSGSEKGSKSGSTW